MSQRTYRTSDRRRVRRLYTRGGKHGLGLCAREIARLPDTPSERTISRWAAEGGYSRSAAEAQRLAKRRKHLQTWREAADMVQSGASKAEAARTLGITRDTVYTALSKELYQ